MTLWSHKRFHPQMRSEGGRYWGPLFMCVWACRCVNECVHMCNLKSHHLWPCSQLSRKHAHTYMPTRTLALGVLMAACVGDSGGPSSTSQSLMNILIMLKSAPCLGFPVPSGKVNSGWLHSTARHCGRTGAERLWRSTVTVLDVSGPKIDLGMQGKYHGNIKVPWSMPKNKQTLQVKPRQLSHGT